MKQIEEIILERITEIRIQKGVSEKQLSRDIGRSASYLSSMNQNKSMPSLRSIIEICNRLEISLGDFFDFSNNRYPAKINEITNELLKFNSDELDTLLNFLKAINGNKIN